MKLQSGNNSHCGDRKKEKGKMEDRSRLTLKHK